MTPTPEMDRLLRFLPTLAPRSFWGEVVIRFNAGNPVRVTERRDILIEHLPQTEADMK